MTKYLIVLLLLAGCASAVPVGAEDICDEECADEAAEPEPQPVDPELPSVEAPEVAKCGIVLTVDPVYLEQVDMVTEALRWEAAIGCPITFGPGGVPVTIERHIYDSKGNEMWGNTSVHTVNGTYVHANFIQISFMARDLNETFGHELGHALGATGGIDGGGHTVDGLLKAWHKLGEDSHINQSALDLVCGNVPCAWQAPEE